MEILNIPYNKYHNGKIYKITDVAYTECYIGSTVQPLCNRMAEHRRHYQQYRRGTKTLEYTSFTLCDKYGVENCKIELVETYKCETKDELAQREGYWIRLEETCLNKQVAGRSKKQYYQDTVDVWREYNKQYRETNQDKIHCQKKEYYNNNKEQILSAQREYYQANKDKILKRVKDYAENNSDKVKEYRLANREKQKEYNIQYRKVNYENNKDKYNTQKMKIITCTACGIQFAKTNKARHEKSQTHLAALENNK